MIRVRDESRIDCADWQMRIRRFAHTDADIVQSTCKCSDPKENQRQSTNIDGEDTT